MPYDETFEIEADRLAIWVSRLVRIPSVNPEQKGPRVEIPGEGQLARSLAVWFSDLGAETSLLEVLPDRPDVIGIWRGSTDKWIAIDVHLDTVGVEQMEGNPFSGEIKGGRVYGRGSVDTKASMGVILAILESIQEQGISLEPNLLILGTMDEEEKSLGAEAFVEWIRDQEIRLDQLVVAEPTMCTPVYGHKGVLRLHFHVHGVSTHTSQPQLGENAITAAAHIVQAFEKEDRRLQFEVAERKLGVGALTVSIIQGGRGLNVVPDSCTISIDRRLVDGEDPEEEMDRLLRLAQNVSPQPVEMEEIKSRVAFLESSETQLVQNFASWSGSQPTVVPFGTNAWVYAGIYRECVVIGPGSIDQAHGAVEWVEISELEKIATLYAQWWGVLK
ncbi:MAG: M20/M25/M40 family metallo-hydrolase [Anaerolineales bacterium]|nr:M20/M25/M40 family metallo-hydrolase [Anaerolineales bacterium]